MKVFIIFIVVIIILIIIIPKGKGGNKKRLEKIFRKRLREIKPSPGCIVGMPRSMLVSLGVDETGLDEGTVSSILSDLCNEDGPFQTHTGGSHGTGWNAPSAGMTVYLRKG